MKLLLLIAGICTFACANEVYKSFDGYQVLRTQASTQDQYDGLVKLYENDETLDFWTLPALGADTDIMVSPEKLPSIRRFLSQSGISNSILLENVGSIIAEQRTSSLKNQDGRMNWVAYQTLDSINQWLGELATNYSNLISVQSIGSSTEGRPILLAKISTGGSSTKPAFFLDSAIHAREWISPATGTYIINELVVNSANYADILNAVDFYIIPVLNVDGYSFSHTGNRMWRKTRSLTNNCYGADANRNFDFRWGSCSGCSSGSPCAETYRGGVAFSEPEAAAVRDYVLGRPNVNWQAYITVHSYGQYFVSPWGYTSSLPVDFPELNTLAQNVAGNITALFGTVYTTGSSAAVIYPTDGTSQDWAYGAGGFKYTYTAELRDTGRFGFLLPPEQIIPTAMETWAGFQVVARYIAAL